LRRDAEVEVARSAAAGLRERLAAFGTPTGGTSGAFVPQFEAEMTRLDGPGDPAAWRRARERWEEAGGLYRAAYCAFREAEAMLGGADADRATVRTLLVDAANYAARERTRPLAEEIEALARRARVDLTTATAGGAATDDEPTAAEEAGLTPREAEVLALVAEGRTNRQIAEALFISDKTASVHVSRILAKLGATNRAEAAAIARRLGVYS
jgi:DNA-binding CsgD family transcriptional regulator